MVAALGAAWLLLAAAACAQRERDFYDFKAVNIRGKLVSLEKYRGSVSARPRGLGAARAGSGGGAPPPRSLPAVAPRGLGCQRRRPGSLPPTRAWPRGCRAPRSRSGSVPRLRGTALALAHSETRNSHTRL